MTKIDNQPAKYPEIAQIAKTLPNAVQSVVHKVFPYLPFPDAKPLKNRATPLACPPPEELPMPSAPPADHPEPSATAGQQTFFNTIASLFSQQTNAPTPSAPTTTPFGGTQPTQEALVKSAKNMNTLPPNLFSSTTTPMDNKNVQRALLNLRPLIEKAAAEGFPAEVYGEAFCELAKEFTFKDNSIATPLELSILFSEERIAELERACDSLPRGIDAVEMLTNAVEYAKADFEEDGYHPPLTAEVTKGLHTITLFVNWAKHVDNKDVALGKELARAITKEKDELPKWLLDRLMVVLSQNPDIDKQALDAAYEYLYPKAHLQAAIEHAKLIAPKGEPWIKHLKDADRLIPYHLFKHRNTLIEATTHPKLNSLEQEAIEHLEQYAYTK